MLNKFIWIMSVLTQQCHTHSSAKTNIYTFLFVLGMFVWSFHFLKTCLDKKESPAVYILANVTLRERTVLVWGVKLCTYCSPAAAPQITCWWLKVSEGYFFQNTEEEPQTNERTRTVCVSVTFWIMGWCSSSHTFHYQVTATKRASVVTHLGFILCVQGLLSAFYFIVNGSLENCQ